MCERDIDRSVASHMPHLGTWPATQTCALSGNQTSDLWIYRLVLSPLSHTSQGSVSFFHCEIYEAWVGEQCCCTYCFSEASKWG